MRSAHALLSALLTVAVPTVATAQSTDDAEDAPAKSKGQGQGKKGKKEKKKDKKDKKADKEKADKADKNKGQPAKAEPDAASPAPAEEAPLPSYDESGEPAGASENPGAPTTTWNATPTAVVEAKAAATPTGYPIELIHRPLTLPRRMIEVRFETPSSTAGPGSISGLLRGSYGISNQLQVGLRYGTGTLSDGEFVTGKTFAIDAEYAIYPWLTGQLSLPFLVDPYAQGVVLGAPMKWSFLDRFSIEILRDLVSFKVEKFSPSVSNAAENEALVGLEATDTALPDGELFINGKAIYQFEPKLAGELRFGYHLIDFESDAAPVEMTAGASYSTTNKLDVSARIGFFDLGHASDTFLAQLGIAIRI